jgi:hypothetical protein
MAPVDTPSPGVAASIRQRSTHFAFGTADRAGLQARARDELVFQMLISSEG